MQHIQNFLDNNYSDFAVYRTLQRLPHVMDSLGQTQRKILFVLERLPESKKSKTNDVYTLIYGETKYLHGDVSAYNVAENLARESSNNINILTNEGSFGFRTNRSAAAPRYTSTRFSKSARSLFHKEDAPLFRLQEFEGQTIEPEYLLPILPVNLFNGYNAIAVGFASKFLPRNPEALIKESIRVLQLKKKKDWKDISIQIIQPDFPFYSGKVIRDVEHEDPSAWLLTGVLKKSRTRNVIEITDVPPEFTRESYLKKLKQYVDNGWVKSYKEGCVKNTFSFSLKVIPEIWALSEDQIMAKFGLVDKVVENFTFLDPSGDVTIIKFDTAEEYLKNFLIRRQASYSDRKHHLLDKLSQEMKILQLKIRFIFMVNNGDIVIVKRKKSDLEQELLSLDFPEIDGDHDYLLGMKMYALTEENIVKFESIIRDKENEYQTLTSLTTEDMHISELRELLKSVQNELKKKGLSVG